MSASLVPRFTTLILDIGDVILNRTFENCRIPSSTMRKIVSTPAWFSYEQGALSEQDCLSLIADQFNLQMDDIQYAFEQAYLSLTPKANVLEYVRELKARSKGRLRVLGMANMTKPAFERLRPMYHSWNIFDEYYISGCVGKRKPSLSFFTHMIAEGSFSPDKAILVDDRIENIVSARSLGMHGILFDDPDAALRRLQSVFDEPSKRGWNFLISQAGKFESITDSGHTYIDNFTQLLIMEAARDSALVTVEMHSGKWNFFPKGGDPEFPPDPNFPCDLETTSLAFTVLELDAGKAHSILDDMLTYVDDDGFPLTYFDHTRPRTDPVTCTNVLAFFAKYGRDHEMQGCFEWIYNILLHRAYLDGTRYYSPDSFLFFLSRLLEIPGFAPEKAALLRPLLKERLYERIGTGGDGLAIAMRILACTSVGVQNSPADKDILLKLQCDDGGWDASWLYRYGVRGTKIGNRGYTTVLALKALEKV